MRRCSRPRCSRARSSSGGSGLRLRTGGERREPGKTLQRPGARDVFAADISVIADAIELGEQEWIAQLLAVGLVARRNAGDLDVPDHRETRAQRHGDVAMQDLTM